MNDIYIQKGRNQGKVHELVKMSPSADLVKFYFLKTHCSEWLLSLVKNELSDRGVRLIDHE